MKKDCSNAARVAFTRVVGELAVLNPDVNKLTERQVTLFKKRIAEALVGSGDDDDDDDDDDDNDGDDGVLENLGSFLFFYFSIFLFF